MRLRRPSIRSGRNVGFDVRGCGSVAASSAACSALRREAGTPKYARLAASIPQMPGPHSATFRYSSRIRSLDRTSSSPSAVAASLSLRIGLREDERYRFFASCWVMVLRSEEHTSELQSHSDLVCRLLLEKKKKNRDIRVVDNPYSLTQTCRR